MNDFLYYSETRPRLKAFDTKLRANVERACHELLGLDEPSTRIMLAHLQGPQSPRNDLALPEHLRQIVDALRASSDANELAAALSIDSAKGAQFLYDVYWAQRYSQLNEPRRR